MWKVEFNQCDCHPETCCCDPYRVVNLENPKLYFTKYDRQDAIKLVEELNKDK